MDKNLLTKFLAFSLILCIVLSSILSAYTNAYIVNAEASDEEMEELVGDAILAALTVAGACFVPEITIPAAIAGIYECYQFGNKIDKYILTDNGDGTATLSADAIQAVIDASLQTYNTFGDDYYNKINSEERTLNNYHITVSGYSSGDYFFSGSADLSSYNPIVGWKDSNGSLKMYSVATDKSYFSVGVTYNGKRYKPDGSLYDYLSLKGGPSTYNTLKAFVCGANFPIFTDQLVCFDYIKTGNGADNAINYKPDRQGIDLRFGNNFSTEYNGGGFTFNLNSLNNFTNYYTQVINSYPGNDDTDKVLQILLDYIKGDSYDLSLSRADNNVLTEGGRTQLTWKY